MTVVAVPGPWSHAQRSDGSLGRRRWAALTEAQERALSAVLDGATGVHDVARRLDAPASSVHPHLVALRRTGLVTWRDRCPGTLRPLIAGECS